MHERHAHPVLAARPFADSDAAFAFSCGALLPEFPRVLIDQCSILESGVSVASLLLFGRSKIDFLDEFYDVAVARAMSRHRGDGFDYVLVPKIVVAIQFNLGTRER